MKPLQNKHVLVTRSLEQTESFVQLLINCGAIPVLLPLINIVPAKKSVEMNTVISSLSSFNWIIFTSSNAIKYFFHFYKEQIPHHLKISCVGAKTNELLKQVGYTAHYIPPQYTSKSLAENLPVKENEKILIPQSSLSDNNLLDNLKKKKCFVQTLKVYENVPNEYDKETLEKIFSEKIDFITFTSASTVNNFNMLVIKYNLNYAESKVVCIGPETKLAAEEKGIRVHAIASPHTTEGILQAIIKLNQE